MHVKFAVLKIKLTINVNGNLKTVAWSARRFAILSWNGTWKHGQFRQTAIKYLHEILGKFRGGRTRVNEPADERQSPLPIARWGTRATVFKFPLTLYGRVWLSNHDLPRADGLGWSNVENIRDHGDSLCRQHYQRPRKPVVYFWSADENHSHCAREIVDAAKQDFLVDINNITFISTAATEK